MHLAAGCGQAAARQNNQETKAEAIKVWPNQKWAYQAKKPCGKRTMAKGLKDSPNWAHRSRSLLSCSRRSNSFNSSARRSNSSRSRCRCSSIARWARLSAAAASNWAKRSRSCCSTKAPWIQLKSKQNPKHLAIGVPARAAALQSVHAAFVHARGVPLPGASVRALPLHDVLVHGVHGLEWQLNIKGGFFILLFVRLSSLHYLFLLFSFIHPNSKKFSMHALIRIRILLCIFN